MSTSALAIIILVVSFFVLMIIRLGVGFSMGLATIITMGFLKSQGVPMSLAIVFQGMVSGTSSFTFMAVPFFMFAGELMSAGGISDRIIAFANALVGWIRGGAAYVNVLASAFFGGISGSATADTAALGPMEIKLMTEQGFDVGYATSLTMASSVEGMLIPPSHNMVIYAVAAGGVSVGALLMAGLIPGLLLAASLAVHAFFYARKLQLKPLGSFNLKAAVKTGLMAFFGLLVIFIIILGVSGGVMTATESASIACLWAFICAIFIYRELKISNYYKVAKKAVKMLSMIFLLVACSNSFGWLVAYLKIPTMITKALLALTTNKYLILLLFNVLLLFLGMIMSMSSIIIILTPILVPVLSELGVSLVHFGCILVLNLGVGLITPPVGGVLFIGSAISGVNVNKLVKSMLPLYLMMIVALLVVTYIPDFSLWFPRLLGYNV